MAQSRLEPIFDEASFGYGRGRSTKDAGSVDHEKLLTLVAQRVADGRVLRFIGAMLKAGS